MTETLQITLIALGGLAFLGIPIGLLIRAGKRSLARQEAELIAKPMAQFELDAALIREFYHWQAGLAQRDRRSLGPLLRKMGLWLGGVLVLAGLALGLWRTSWYEGALLGLVCTALIMLPVLLVVGLLALGSRIGERKLRRLSGMAARAWVGPQGVTLQPGGFHPVIGELYSIDLLPGPPLVLQLGSRSVSPPGHNWRYSRTPVPAADAARAAEVVALLRERFGASR